MWCYIFKEQSNFLKLGTISYSQTPYIRGFLQFCQYLVLDLFVLVIIMGMKWYFIVFLINIFLMANESCLNYFSIAMTNTMTKATDRRRVYWWFTVSEDESVTNVVGGMATSRQAWH